jgi:general secretion pathway protein A
MQKMTPFSISPNPLSLYLTDSLKAVVHKARSTIDYRQGLTCILGDVGLGKSTILRFLWAEYAAQEDNCKTAFISTPSFPSPFAMLKSICQDFGLEAMRSREAQKRLFETYLVEQFKTEKNVVIFIDEAQMLTNQQLELLREILNFETNTEKLVQIVVAGQMELKLKINRQQNRPFKSRIMSYSNLNPLSLEETREMINFRCKFAEAENPFPEKVIDRIYYHTQGIPRSVLKLCYELYELHRLGVLIFTPDLVDETASEVAL